MQIASVIVCDAATVREGLLHVLGGGITRLWRTELPAPLGVALAVTIEMEREVEHLPHEIRVEILGPEDQRVGDAVAGIQYGGGARLEPGECHLLAIAIPLQNIGISAYGRHRLIVRVDDDDEREIGVWVLHPDEQEMPPLTD